MCAILIPNATSTIKVTLGNFCSQVDLHNNLVCFLVVCLEKTVVYVPISPINYTLPCS